MNSFTPRKDVGVGTSISFILLGGGVRSESLSDLPKVTQLVRTELWASRVLSPSPFSPDCYQDP